MCLGLRKNNRTRKDTKRIPLRSAAWPELLQIRGQFRQPQFAYEIAVTVLGELVVDEWGNPSDLRQYLGLNQVRTKGYRPLDPFETTFASNRLSYPAH